LTAACGTACRRCSAGKLTRLTQLTYAGGLVRCGCCGNLITGEQIIKPATGKHYIYYRCTVSRLTTNHLRIRVTERELDEQILAVFRSIKQSDEVSEWFKTALRQWNANHRIGSQEHTGLLQKELTQLRLQQDKLLNLRLADEIDADAFAMKKTELRDRIANTTLQMEVVDRDRGEQGELAIKTFELSQALEQKWFIAGFAEKRKLLELVFSNFRLDGVSLCYQIKKPFDILAKGPLVLSSRGDWTPIELFNAGVQSLYPMLHQVLRGFESVFPAT
jgi:site-specific DNA recombinase